ncbi:hypothetical protein GGS21DRAFT_509993 [Xylaria nigripes]|nr:hypothetical protein GGS21DRAFT_509993 [Xylaria nigripes]
MVSLLGMYLYTTSQVQEKLAIYYLINHTEYFPHIFQMAGEEERSRRVLTSHVPHIPFSCHSFLLLFFYFFLFARLFRDSVSVMMCFRPSGHPSDKTFPLTIWFIVTSYFSHITVPIPFPLTHPPEVLWATRVYPGSAGRALPFTSSNKGNDAVQSESRLTRRSLHNVRSNDTLYSPGLITALGLGERGPGEQASRLCQHDQNHKCFAALVSTGFGNKRLLA